MTEMIPLEEARSIVLSHINALEHVEVDLLDAAGRVAAEDLKSDIDSAPFNQAAMDGFAVRVDQLANATEDAPVQLKVIKEIAAGDFYEGEMADDECLRIMTGAPVPPCAEAVVQYERVINVSGDGMPGGVAGFTAPTSAGKNVRAAGEEAKAGEVIVAAGEVINSAGVGVLAGCGNTRIPTFKRPTVAIIATGSELVDPSEIPTRGKIRNSNSYAIAACVKEAGGIPTILPICKDTFDDLAAAVKNAASEYDVVVTTGGAANGDFDFIERVVNELGEVYVSLINMRPGKAEVFGLVDGVPVFGLPGNPAAAYIGFQMLVRPTLRKMQGYSHFDLVEADARLAVDIKAKKDARMTLSRALLTKDGEGNRMVEPLKKQSSGLFGPLQHSNALIVVPRGDESIAAGTMVRCVLLDIPEEVIL